MESNNDTINTANAAEKLTSEKKHAPEYKGKAHNFDPVPREIPVMTDTVYIRDRLDDQMNWLDRKSSFHQQQYKNYKRLEFGISAAIPILISFSTMRIVENAEAFGMPLHLNTIFQITSAVAGVAVVILNKMQELEEHFKLWKDYRVTAESLKQERLRYLTRTEPYDEADAYPLLVENVESILIKDIQSWRSTAKKQSEKKSANSSSSVEKKTQVADAE